jgi:ferredoxin
MSARVDLSLLDDIKKYGQVNVEKCYNCGNCTAICPLAANGETFPRRLIRYAQLGLKERLLSSKELWLCYYCGECTQTCPKEADPGEFMAAARRYAIASYDPTGLARLLYTSPIGSAIFLVLLPILIALVVFTSHGPMETGSLQLFEFIPVTTIHNLGVIAMAILGLSGLIGLVNMVRQVRKENPLPGAPGMRVNWLGALWNALVVEGISQRRYHQDCQANADPPRWYAQKWLVHATIVWGFLGLLASTALDFGLDLIGVKAAGTWVPLWYPIRLLGTISGLFLLYGTTAAAIRRFRKTDESSAVSAGSDWVFLLLLWLTGASGFVLEIALYLPYPGPWAYWTLLFHISMAGELLLLLPFTKFAHVVYRTVALYFHALKPLPADELAGASAD